MSPLIPIAISLAKEFLPSLVGKIAGDKSGGVAQKVLDGAGELVGVQVDGVTTADMVSKAIRQNPELAMQFQQRMAEIDAAELEAYLADRQSARARDVALANAGRMNVRADMMVIAAFVAVTVIAVFLITSEMIAEGVLAFLTTIGGMLMKNISTAFDFEFGSSRSSKGKTEDTASFLRELTATKRGNHGL